MPDRRSGWLITCSCGWTRELSQRWAAESAAKLHPKLSAAGVTHTLTIKEPPRGLGGVVHHPVAVRVRPKYGANQARAGPPPDAD